jgi:hypothetical protein
MVSHVSSLPVFDIQKKTPIEESGMPRLRFLAAIALFACCARSNGAAQTAEQPKTQPDLPAQYAAVAFGQSGSVAGKTFGLTVYVQELTRDGEIEELAATLKHKGPDGLVSALEDIKDKGRVVPAGAVGTGMRVVRMHPTKDGGQHIVLATTRLISFPELYNATRSRDYKFGIVVLDVDKDGKGTGSFAPLCKVKFNKKNELEVEHYGHKPFRLANVYRQK